jgi:ferrous-iron efflux pump FieF
MTDLHHEIDVVGAQLRRRAALAALTVAVTLAVLKLGGALATGSIALVSTLLDSAADVAAVLLTVVAVRISVRPADREHRYGHGKAEGLSSLGQMTFILVSAGAVLAAAANRLVDQQPIHETGFGIAVMGISAALTLGIVLYQRRVVTRTGSYAIAADRTNFTGDLAVAAGIIASLAVTEATDELWIDPAMAVIVAAYLLRNAFRLWQAASNLLLDRELPDTDRDRIQSIALAHPEAHGVHDVRTRSTGVARFVELHVEIEGGLSLERAHDIISEIEQEIMTALPGSEVLIHPEPAGIQDERLDHRIEGAGS